MPAVNPAVLPTLFEVPSLGWESEGAVTAVVGALAETRRELARQWLAMPPEQCYPHYLGRLGGLCRVIMASGLRSMPPTTEDRELTEKILRDWKVPGKTSPAVGTLLAGMVMLPPHQLPYEFDLAGVPGWLTNDYLTYLLNPPELFREPGEAEQYRRFMEAWIGYLHTMVFANSGNENWRKLAVLVAQIGNFIAIYFNDDNLRDLYQKRAQLIEFALTVTGLHLDYAFPPRPFRPRIRIGILAAHFVPQTETFATLPVYRWLDRTRFEVILFSLAVKGHPLEQICASYADRFVALPPQLPQQVQIIRGADLDLIFLATNVTAVTNGITTLAMHRLARVQIASVCSCVSTGIRNVDYYISGTLSEPTDNPQQYYSERLLMVDGPAHCYDFGTTDAQAATQTPTRADLVIDEDEVVFISGANFFKIIPELEEHWMRIVAAVPRSRLLLYPFNPNWSSVYPVDWFVGRLVAAAHRHGVKADRITVFRPAPARADLLHRLRLADVYLDSFPFSGATSLLDPLEVGLPTVTRDGTTFRNRVGPALLRDLECEDLVAKTDDEYVQIAVKLGADPAERSRARSRIIERMKAGPHFLNGLWYSQQMAALFQKVCPV